MNSRKKLFAALFSSTLFRKIITVEDAINAKYISSKEGSVNGEVVARIKKNNGNIVSVVFVE